MTLREILTRTGIDVSTLTAGQRAKLDAWADCDFYVSRWRKILGRLEVVAGETVTRAQLVNFLARYMVPSTSPPAIFYIYEGE